MEKCQPLCACGGRASRRGTLDSAIPMAGGFEPPFSLFLREEKEKTGRSRSKREKDAPAGASQVRWNPTVPTNENEEDHMDLACLSFRCRCCGGCCGLGAPSSVDAAATL